MECPLREDSLKLQILKANKFHDSVTYLNRQISVYMHIPNNLGYDYMITVSVHLIDTL